MKIWFDWPLSIIIWSVFDPSFRIWLIYKIEIKKNLINWSVQSGFNYVSNFPGDGSSVNFYQLLTLIYLCMSVIAMGAVLIFFESPDVHVTKKNPDWRQKVRELKLVLTDVRWFLIWFASTYLGFAQGFIISDVNKVTFVSLCISLRICQFVICSFLDSFFSLFSITHHYIISYCLDFYV